MSVTTNNVIVAIDDDAEMLELYKLILERNGYQLHTFTSGSEGIEAVERILPDLVLTDLMMPAIDGWEVALELKNNPRTSPIPIILCCAKVINDDDDMSLFDGTITLPVGPKELLESIKQFIDA